MERFEERQEFEAAEDIEIHALEAIAFPWNWDWASAEVSKEVEEARETICGNS